MQHCWTNSQTKFSYFWQLVFLKKLKPLDAELLRFCKPKKLENPVTFSQNSSWFYLKHSEQIFNNIKILYFWNASGRENLGFAVVTLKIQTIKRLSASIQFLLCNLQLHLFHRRVSQRTLELNVAKSDRIGRWSWSLCGIPNASLMERIEFRRKVTKTLKKQ